MTIREDERRENVKVHREGTYDNWGWGWMFAAAVALLIVGGAALYSTGHDTSTSAVTPDATTGQGGRALAPATPPPAKNR
jgi:hypothetical protein